MLKSFIDLSEFIQGNQSFLSWIDRDKGQLEAPAEFEALLTPALLINCGNVTWEGGSGGSQKGYSTIELSLVLPLPPNTSRLIDLLTLLRHYVSMHEQLHEIMQKFPGIGVRRGSGDYFTNEYYVQTLTYDFTQSYTRAVLSHPKPRPDVLGTVELPSPIS